MKKLAKLAALLAAAALLFGAVGCSGGDDDPPAKTLEGIKITADDTVKRQYDVGADLDLTGITVTAEYSDKSEEDVTGKAEFTATYKDADGTDKPFDTKTEGIFNVTLTAAYGGKTDSLDPCEITVGDGNPDADLDSIRIDVDEAAVKTEYKQNEAFNLNNLAGITVKAVYKDADGNETEQDVTSSATFTATHGEGEGKETFDTSLEIGTYEVTLTATFRGETDFVITHITIVENDSEPTDPEPTGTTYAWNFQAAGLKTYLTLTGGILDFETTYESNPAGLTLVFPEGLKIDELDTGRNGLDKVGASNGAIQTKTGENGDMCVEVQGPFTATMLYGSNSSDPKTDRYAFIKIGDEEVAKSAQNIPTDGAELSYTYEETDTVKVSFGGSNAFRIYDIKITTANGDGAGKTADEVKSTATFTPQPVEVENTADKLGLVGDAAVSDDNDIATAKIENEKVIITSAKKAGSATITVTKTGISNGAATIAVTVKLDGSITLGAITKYVNPDIVVESAQWTVTPDNDNSTTTIAGDDGLTAVFTGTYDKGFKFGSGNDALTLTTTTLAQGKTITIKVTGKSGSSNNTSDITLTATNAEAADGNADDNKITFPSSGSEDSGTFVYTVTEKASVTLTFKRDAGRTTRLTKLEITVN